MSLVQGKHLDEYLATKPSQRERDLLGERLVELYYRQVLEFEAFHCDPHWGNYLFAPGGTVGLVDFGAVKHLPSKFVANLRALFLYPGDRRSEHFAKVMDERYSMYGTTLTKRSREALMDFSEEFYGRVYPPDPAQDETPVDFGDPEIIRLYMRHSHHLLHSKASLPEYLMLARAETGLYQTLQRLAARVRASKMVRKYLRLSPRA
jgi:predicted unusual protein kinase regulating ubiquinone biosynthesis (AarF/ABC1/UbiB family)